MENVKSINISYGSSVCTELFSFCPADASWSAEKVDIEFDKAVKELNRVYAFGRLATKDGVNALFRTFGFNAVKEENDE